MRQGEPRKLRAREWLSPQPYEDSGLALIHLCLTDDASVVVPPTESLAERILLALCWGLSSCVQRFPNELAIGGRRTN